ncbi:xanthine dehydrogenase small subunit [Litoribacillus peritrichatus]|uniref:Xanthine dehydrogenase small subunit n=1 Tax=Litoribacillus peritrichatus TaxID=718191 RepID=A0ABP7MM63_9GAMM
MIKFCLNGRWIEEADLTPDTTVLRYLRTRKSLTGTKEGCGSGDCGACSVLLGEKQAGKWVYKAINGCITFLAQLHGKSVITIDALADGRSLHPAQQAMVDYHGSQCGFCTPGIIMSLAALHQNVEGEQPSEHQILDALSGNLCRCTGYRPIIDAARNMNEYPDVANVGIWQPEEQLSGEIHNAGTEAERRTRNLRKKKEQSWVVENEAQLKDLLAEHPDARMVAGATDLALEVTQFNKSINKLVSIGAIESLKTIEVTDDKVTFGGAATYAEIEETLTTHYPEFSALLDRLGSRQVRNNGTLGGNVGNASPIGDTPPVLIALGAELELVSKHTHRWLPIDQFFLDYKQTALQSGEYIRAIRVPRLQANQTLKVFKISKRIEDDISAVLAAFVVTSEDGIIKDVRTGFGGMAGIPKAACNVERALVGKPLSEVSFMNAANELPNDFTPLSDVRATAEYRIQVAKGLMRKCALELLEPEKISRIEQVHSAALNPNDVLTAVSGSDKQGEAYHA